ncbi:MAG TPA: glycosyltransferase family 9 protein [Pyrinomonadaceae bacterium]|nr:glycosyltransferase family 9 protein [Pyrinomonadaceae bacterium]
MDLRSFFYSRQWRLRQKLAAFRFGGTGPPTNSPLPTGFAPGKVLFVLAGLIGDSVMSMSAIAAAREILPEATFVVLGKRVNRELLGESGLDVEFYEFENDPFSLRHRGQVKKLQQWLTNQRFDLAIILLGDQFAPLLARAEIPVRVGVAGTLLENCLTHTYEIGSPRTWGTNDRLNALRCLGYIINDRLPQISVDHSASLSARKRLKDLGWAEEDYIVLHPFGSTRRQWWNLEAAVKLSETVKKKHRLSTVLVGGPEARGSINSESLDHAIDATGMLSLAELLAVVADAKIVVTTDSGPYHIAGALAKPIVGLFRARRPEHAGAYPNTNVILGQNNECTGSCDWDRCETLPCRQMEQITVAEVLAAIEVRL